MIYSDVKIKNKMKKQGRNLQNNYEKKFKSIIYFYNLIDNGQHSNILHINALMIGIYKILRLYYLSINF